MRVKIPIVKVGKWHHPVYGELDYSESDLQSLKKNYEEDVLGFKPYITYGHLDEEPASTDGERKRGDIEEVVMEEDVLFGFVDAPPTVYEAIQKKEFEYTSPEIYRNFQSKETGEPLGLVFSRVALTNAPYLPWKDVKVEALSTTTGTRESISIPLHEEKEMDKTELEALLKGFKESLSQEMKETIDGLRQETATSISTAVGSLKEEVQVAVAAQLTDFKSPIEQQLSELTNVVASLTKEPEKAKEEEEKVEETPQLATEPPKEATPESTTPPTPSMDESIKAALQQRIEELRQETLQQKTQYEQQLAAQQQQIAVLSQDHAKRQRHLQEMEWFNRGIPPAYFEQLHSLTNTQVKLSQGETETNQSAAEMVISLVEKLSQGAAPMQSLGNSLGQAPVVTGFDVLKEQIEKNKKAAGAN